jgi:hypothetical protein
MREIPLKEQKKACCDDRKGFGTKHHTSAVTRFLRGVKFLETISIRLAGRLNASRSTPVRKTCRQSATRLSAVSLYPVDNGGCAPKPRQNSELRANHTRGGLGGCAPKPPISCGAGLDFGGELLCKTNTRLQ